MVERSDTTGHRSSPPSAPGRGASPVPPPALASLPGCRSSRSRGSPVVSSPRSSTTGYKQKSLRLHGRWTRRPRRISPPEPMTPSPIRHDGVWARSLPPLASLRVASFPPPRARIWGSFQPLARHESEAGCRRHASPETFGDAASSPPREGTRPTAGAKPWAPPKTSLCGDSGSTHRRATGSQAAALMPHAARLASAAGGPPKNITPTIRAARNVNTLDVTPLPRWAQPMRKEMRWTTSLPAASWRRSRISRER